MNDSRPSPDALLKAYHHEEGDRGKLKVFLGAAPGVGKTYAMLNAARICQREGIQVLVGIVETHGRSETAELLQELEVLPRLKLDYRGKVLEEMDLDAILKCQPPLVLVDELAHTNLGECRHPKRYQDVEELLAAGIDVFTTINIQHLESLNDAIAQITGIRVQETIPDSFLEKADSIELIDLPPEELHQRLREGKVYLPERAHLAIDKYFRLGNLSALRELALRFTAEHVDEQMQTYRQAHAIQDFWPTTERLIVSVGPGPFSARLLRATKRMVENRNAEWIAVYIETPGHYRLSDTARNNLAQNLNLAEQLGAEVVSVPGDRIAHTLVVYARERNATEIVIGKSLRSFWHHLFYGSIVHDTIRQSQDIDVCVITAPEDPAPQQAFLKPESRPKPWLAYLYSVTVVALFALLTAFLKFAMAFEDPAIFFLTGILLIAFYLGLRPALFGMVLSIAVYNFFFIPPYFSFSIASSSDLLKFSIFTFLSILTSNLAARSRLQAFAAQQREAKTAKLFQLSRELASAGSLADVCKVVVEQVSQIVGCQTVLLLPEQDKLTVQAIYPEQITFQERDLAVAVWAFEHGEPAGHGSNTLPGADWFCLPLQTENSRVGVLGIQFRPNDHPLGPEERRLLQALTGQALIAIERARLVQGEAPQK